MLAEKLFKVSQLICSLNGIKCTLTEVQRNTKVLCIAFCLEQTVHDCKSNIPKLLDHSFKIKLIPLFHSVKKKDVENQNKTNK